VTRAGCVVVGGGPAGLAAARWLTDRAIPVTVLEAESSVGGRTRSEIHEGFVLDRGAAFLTSFYPRTLELVGRSALELTCPALHPGRSTEKQYLATPAGLMPHDIGTPRGLLRFPLLSAREKAATVTAILRLCCGRSTHIADPFSLSRHDTEDAFSWGRRWFGKGPYEFVVRSAIEPFFFYSTEEVSAAVPRALLRHALRWRLLTPVAGMGSLCAALAGDLDVRLDHRVRTVRSDSSGIVVEHSRGETRADTAIIAVPAHVLESLAIPISAADAADIGSAQYIPNVRLYLGYRHHRPELRAPAVTPAGPGRHAIAGITSMSQWIPTRVPRGQEVVAISARAWRSRDLIGLPEEEVARELLRDCAALGIELPTPEWTVVFSEPMAIVLPRPGHFRRMVAFLTRSRRGIRFAGDWLTGSTIEGAVYTGQLAAEAAWRELRDAR
jgi:protoporphyrinogen oxidase